MRRRSKHHVAGEASGAQGRTARTGQSEPERHSATHQANKIESRNMVFKLMDRFLKQANRWHFQVRGLVSRPGLHPRTRRAPRLGLARRGLAGRGEKGPKLTKRFLFLRPLPLQFEAPWPPWHGHS